MSVDSGERWAVDEADIRRKIDEHGDALREMDLDRVMAIYAPDIVSFDIVPPLRYAGVAAKQEAWENAFAIYKRPLGYAISDPTITVSNDIAFSHSLVRVSNTLKDGGRTAFWLRWTACFRKIDGDWLITHEQVSVPVDLMNGRALLDLEP